MQSTLTFPTLLHVAGEIGIPEDAEDYQKTLTDFFLRYVDLMARAGYGKQFIEWEQETHARAITVSPQKPQPADLFAIVQEQLGDERWQGLSLGEVAASFTERWTRSFPDQTTQIVRAFNDDISRKGTLNDVCRYVTESTRWLNGRREWQLSGEIVDELLGRLEHSEVDLSAEQRADLWNEIGNTCRYLDAAEQSLTAYTLAKKASVGLPDEDQRLAILAHNRAIVLRDSGRLTEAEAEFKQLEAAQPDDAGVLHSLAVLYDHVGRVEEAVDYLARALAIPTLLPDEAALFLFSRAHAHQQLGADDAALTDLQRAWQILSTNSGDLRLRIATVGVRCRPTDSNLQAFRDELVGFALEHGSASAHVRGSAGAMALLAIAEAALLRGDTRAARSALEIVLPAPRIPNPAHIGEVAVAWAWLLVVEGAPGAWPWLVASLQSHESSMPREGDASFALTWLRRTAKVTDRILELAPRVTSEASDLIWVYETANGRELTAADQLPDRPPNWTELVRDATRAVPSDLVVLLDGIERITAIVFQAASAEPVVQPVDLTSAELDAAVAALAAFDDANPVAPHRIDRKLKAWWRAAATLADAVRPWLTDGAELVILPGRRLASTPLHLAGWPQTPLIFDRPVSVCPNARILTRLNPQETDRWAS